MLLTQNRDVLLWTPRILAILVIVMITVYTIFVFSDLLVEGQAELFFYLIPSFTLGVLTFLMYRHEMLSGMLFIIISFGFLLIYQINIALTVFSLLFLIGGLLLFDNRFIQRGNRKAYGK